MIEGKIAWDIKYKKSTLGMHVLILIERKGIFNAFKGIYHSEFVNERR